MDDKLLTALKDDLSKALTAYKGKLGQVRTGRASAAMLDGVRVEQYGSFAPVSQVATVAVPEPRLITISPWDKTLIPQIEKAIIKSDLGLAPSSDGKVIRLSLPELTMDRRKELVKQLKKLQEEARVVVRGFRRDYLEKVKAKVKSKEISEDDERRYNDKIQTTTDEFVAKVDEATTAKEKEIMAG